MALRKSHRNPVNYNNRTTAIGNFKMSKIHFKLVTTRFWVKHCTTERLCYRNFKCRRYTSSLYSPDPLNAFTISFPCGFTTFKYIMLWTADWVIQYVVDGLHPLVSILSSGFPSPGAIQTCFPIDLYIIIIGFFINMQVQGHHPHQWVPFQVTG